MTLFAVSIFGALSMALYGLRVLVSRWDQPRQSAALRPVPKLPPLGPLQPQVARPTQPPPVWVSPAGTAPVPAPLVVPVGIATPPPMMMSPAGPSPIFMPPLPPKPVASAAPVFMPPLPPQPAPQAAPVFMPPLPRAPSPGYPAAGALAPRIARGSIPPDYAGVEAPELELEPEPDTDPGVPLEAVTAGAAPAVVQRGARFSVVRSSRR